MEKLCKTCEDKLCTLLSYLKQFPGELETMADEIDNENLKNALSSIATESNQYAAELYGQLRLLKIDPPLPVQVSFFEKIMGLQDVVIGKGKEILNICDKSEAFFTMLYTEALTEYFPNTYIKDMINYQLLGIKSAFMRIRLLNTLRYS